MEVWDRCVGGYGWGFGFCDVKGDVSKCVSNDTHTSSSINLVHFSCLDQIFPSVVQQANRPGFASRYFLPSTIPYLVFHPTRGV